ncbi:hypothetical protein PInf_018182 [Phytophthora infestans]|nr:hypothetical protein PInf_018110 [Phytophthora infestans]KAI9990628.1 hypothetical protein PInf_018182 [Phytophthora infestans]
MGWMRFVKDLHDGRIEQICILMDIERMKSEAEELRQLHASSSLYDVLLDHKDVLEHKDVLPEVTPADISQDKGIQHETNLVQGTKYCVTRQ